MFDLQDFELHNSIARYKQKAMLEAEKAAKENKKKMMESIIDTLVYEYDRTYNTEASKVIERKMLREAAVISAVKDALYGIYESALLLDQSAKDEYRDNIKSIFEAYFYQTLKENNINTLSQFKKFVKDANGIFESIIERAENFVEMNEAVFTELLENHYNSTSLDNLILEAFDAAANPEESVESKSAKAKAMVDKLIMDFQRFTLEQKFASAHKLIQAAIIILRLGVSMDKIWYSLVDKLLVAVNSIFGKESTESLKEKLINKTLKDVENYYYIAIDVAITLKKLQKKFPPDSKDYIKLGDRIASIYKAIIIINKYRQQLLAEAKGDKPLKEMSYAEFITEADAAIAKKWGKEDVVNSLRQIVNNAIADFDPYEGLNKLQLVNKVVSQPEYYQTFIDWGNAGSNVVLLIVSALKHQDTPEKVKNQFIKEAKDFKNNLDNIIDYARKNGKLEYVSKLVKQSKRLEIIINHFQQNGYLNDKLVRESVSSGLLSISYKESFNMFASNLSEAAQFITLYEANADDMKEINEMVCNCNESDPIVNEDLMNLIRVARNEFNDNNVSDDVYVEYLKLEANVYKKLYMVNPAGISEAAGNELKQGKYPKLEDFLDNDEKELINCVISANGKDDIIDVIKNKVINVIESEEKRIAELEAKEEEMIAKLSKKNSDDENKKLQESIRVNLRGVGPANLFEAIVMNRSKKYIQEGVSLGTGFDLDMNKNTIMAESIALYTIHETFNTLKFGNYDQSKINKLMVDYYNGKI